MPGSAVGWIAMLCMDTTVFIMTLVKTSQMRSYAHHGLFSVLFRDGKLQEPILSLYNRLSSLALRCRVLRVRILGSSHTSRRNDFCTRVLVVAGVANLLTFLVRRGSVMGI